MDRSLRRSTLGGDDEPSRSRSAHSHAHASAHDLSAADLNDSSLSLSLSGFGSMGQSLRASMGAPGRSSRLAAVGSAKKPHAHAQSRMSMQAAPAAAAIDARRSSLVGRSMAGLTGPRTDPRPISSKAWVGDSILALLAFLSEADFTQRMSPKILAQPTGKDFTAIVTFMFRMLDPGWAVTGKMEDDVQAVFRALRYPFPISKTSLTAVGSPQSWPALLATLVWLCELLRYDAALRANEEEAGESAGAGGDAFFWQYVSQAYAAFLAGEDDAVASLDAEVARAFGAKHSEIETEIEALRKANAGLEAEITASRQVQSTLPALRTSKTELTADIDKLRRALTDIEAHRDTLTAKLDEYKTKLAARETEIDRVSASLADVQRVVDTQELSPKDVERMTARKAELRRQVGEFASDASRIQQDNFALSVSIKKSVAELTSRIAEYTDLCTRLQLLPVGAKNSCGVDFSIRMNEGYLQAAASDDSFAGASKATTRGLLHGDLSLVKDTLRTLNKRMAEQAAEHEHALLAMGEAAAALRETKAEMTARVDSLGKNLHGAEELLASARAECESVISGAETDSAQLREKLRQARSELAAAQSASRELSHEVLRGLELQVSTTISALDAQRRKASDVMAHMLLAVTKHKETVCDKLEAVRMRTQARRDTISSLPRLAIPPPLSAMQAVQSTRPTAVALPSARMPSDSRSGMDSSKMEHSATKRASAFPPAAASAGRTLRFGDELIGM